MFIKIVHEIYKQLVIQFIIEIKQCCYKYAVKVKRHRPSVVVDPRNVVHAL